MPRKYEAFYIVKPQVPDTDLRRVVERFQGVVETNGGTVSEAGPWEGGRRKLAYEIDGHKEGSYVLMQFEAEGTVPAELSRLMGISDDVIRHRIFKIED
jgi:small subunit ribosomal protein S6